MTRGSLGWWLSIALGVFGVLAVVWSTGALDARLSGIGLNRQPCVVAVQGKLCGDDARAWCSAHSIRRGRAVGEPPASGTCEVFDGP